jgi:hypothetical protein
MDNLARKYQEISMIQEQGVITNIEKETYTVETQSGMYDAQQAVSCLTQPLLGDKVLLVGSFVDGFYVLAVLKREEGQKHTLSFHGEVDFRAEDGRLTIAAQEGMALASAKDIALASSELDIHSVKSEVSIHRLIFNGGFWLGLFNGGFWLGQVERLKLIATTFDSIVERLSQRIKRSYRTVEDIDQLRAGRLDYLIDKLLSLRGKYAMFTAKEDVKIDAERIHMG